MTQQDITEPVVIEVDCSAPTGELAHLWNSIGFDEINWSYTPRGQRLLKMLKDEVVAEQPYYVRNHNAFTSGNGLSYPAGGSTNVYREDAEGRAVYNWEITDQIYDAYIANGFKPLIELGFLPFDLVPEEKQEYATFRAGQDLGKEPYENGKWKLPPKDYGRWEALVEAFVAHLVERYGAEEVAGWYFELWNEPDIPNYWRGTVEEYCRLYDHSVAGAKRAFDRVKIGGPGTTNGGTKFLRHFLAHCTGGTNAITGQTGTQLDFVSFHSKGAYYNPRRSYGHPVENDAPSLSVMMGHVRDNIDVIAEFPGLHRLPVFIDECDPAVGTIYGVYDNPNFVVCNTEYYPTFVAALVGQILEHNGKVPVPVKMITHWSFYMEGKRYFEGNRVLATNDNIPVPFTAGLKMLGRLGQRQLKLNSSGACDVLAEGYTAQTRVVDGLATLKEGSTNGQPNTVSVMVWNHYDDWTVEGAQPVKVSINGLPFEPGQSVLVRHWRIDNDHSNAYSEWVRLGRPEGPDRQQLERLKASAELSMLQDPPEQHQVNPNGSLSIEFNLPHHALSLLEIEPASR